MKTLVVFAVIYLVSVMGVGALLSNGPEITNLPWTQREQGSSSYWAPDIRLTSSPLNSIQPSAVRDAEGNIHVAWADDRAGETDIYYKKVNSAGDELLPEQRLSTGLSVSRYPDIAADRFGYIHVTWLDNRGGMWNVYYARLDVHGKVMVSGLQITSIQPGPMPGTESIRKQPQRLDHLSALTDPAGLGPSIDVDDVGNAHISWCDMRDGNSEVRYSVLSADGKILTDQLKLSRSATDSANAVVKVWEDQVIVLWAEHTGDQSQIYYARLDSAGNFIVEPAVIFGGLSCKVQLDAGVDTEGSVSLVWSSAPAVRTEIFYARISPLGEPVGATIRVTESKQTSNHPHMELDSAGNVRLVWVEEEERADVDIRGQIFYTKLAPDGTQLEPLQAVTKDQYRSFGPALVLTETGAPLAIWSDTRNGPANAEIYSKVQVSLEYTIESTQNVVQTKGGVNIVPLAAAVGGGGIVLAAALTDLGRYKLSLLLVPLYSRLKKEGLLNHSIREQIFGYVSTHPGANFSQIMKELKLKNGVLAYHLNTLEREELIKSMREGTYRRYYPKNDYGLSDELGKVILAKIEESPGILQSSLAEELNLNRENVNHHLAGLIQGGRVRIERRGKRNLCFATQWAA